MNIEFYWRQIIAKYPRMDDGSVHSLLPITEGWGSFVLEVDGRYIFRFPRYAEIKAAYEKEAVLLPKLAGALPLAVPDFKFSYLDDPQAERCFVGYDKIPGLRLSAEACQSPVVIQQLGDFLAALHNLPEQHPARQYLSSPDASWQGTFRDFYAWIQVNVYPLLEPADARRSAALWDNYLGNPAHFSFRAVLVHGDLGVEHILCAGEAGGAPALTGVIDWEDATLGDPAFDFVGLLDLGGAGLVERVLKAYQRDIEAGFLERADFYLRAVPFHQVQYGLMIQDPQHICLGLQQIHQALEETI